MAQCASLCRRFVSDTHSISPQVENDRGVSRLREFSTQISLTLRLESDAVLHRPDGPSHQTLDIAITSSQISFRDSSVGRNSLMATTANKQNIIQRRALSYWNLGYAVAVENDDATGKSRRGRAFRIAFFALCSILNINPYGLDYLKRAVSHRSIPSVSELCW
jgi:hypothetical protein